MGVRTGTWLDGAQTDDMKKNEANQAATASYDRLEASERRKCYAQGVVVNFFLLLYGFFAGAYILANVGEDPAALGFDLKFVGFAALVALGASLLWTRSESSIGWVMIRRTSKVLKNQKRSGAAGSFWRTSTGILSLVLLIETFWMGALMTEMSFYSLFSYEGLMGAKRIFQSIFAPELGILGMVLEAMVVTIFIAFMATALAIPLAFPLSFLCARNLMKKSRGTAFVYTALRVLFNFMRSVEPLIWAIIFSVWVGIGPFAGMLALMLHSVASLAKLYSEQIEDIDEGPVEAIETTGANTLQVIWYAIVPQVVLPFLSFTIYRWDINVRMATIIGLVGGGGVGTLLMQYQGLAKWNEVGTIVIVISIVVWFMDYMSARIREAIY